MSRQHVLWSYTSHFQFLSIRGNANSEIMQSPVLRQAHQEDRVCLGVGVFGANFSFPRLPCMSKTCGGSILPQRLPELGNTDSEIINSDYMILPALVCSATPTICRHGFPYSSIDRLCSYSQSEQQSVCSSVGVPLSFLMIYPSSEIPRQHPWGSWTA